MQPSTSQHRRLEKHEYKQEVWKKSHGVWLEACRHQLMDNLPHSDLLHHTIDIGFETQGAVSKDLLYHGTLATTLAFASLAFATFSTCSCLCCHGMIHQCFVQPTLLSDHQVRGLQSQARNHVLASLDSECHELPCTSDRLRTSSCQRCTLLPRMNQEHQGPTHPDGSSQTLQPRRFPDQHSLPSRHTLRLGIVATWILPSHCTRSHLQSGRFLLPTALAHNCPLCQPWTGDDTKSDDGASLPHVQSEVFSTGPSMLGSLGVDPRPKVCL